MSDGTVLDGTVSESPSRQSSQIWELRERIAEALKKDGYTYKYDISLPLDTFYDRYFECSIPYENIFATILLFLIYMVCHVYFLHIVFHFH